MFVLRTDFGTAIKNSGLLKKDGTPTFMIFICNNATNNPLGNGYIFLIHSSGYYLNNPQYLYIASNTMKSGTLCCDKLDNLTLK